MTFVDAIKTGFAKYADFKGRASKSEFWYFFLFYFLAVLVLNVVAAMLQFSMISIFILGLIVPMLSVGARRMHDIDKSGWMQLLGLIPLAGFFILIYFFIQEPKEPNRFGTGALATA